MSMDRREFMKIAALSAVFGVGGPLLMGKLGARNLEASEFGLTPGGKRAKRWAMVIDVSKIKGPADYARITRACRKAHNVPVIPDPKHEVMWIWTDDYEHVFEGTDNPYMEANVKDQTFLLMCNHCDHPACVRVCPTKATFKRPDGIVMQDYHRCIGCRFCMAACPYGSRSFNWVDPRPYIKDPNPTYPTRMIGVVEKCTFCVERLDQGLDPACVLASNGAMVSGDLMDPNGPVRKLLASNFTLRRKPDLGTSPNVYYVIAVIGGGKNA
ncbi:MAG: 4Fe-4S dicluster domain-containing protein [Nitrospiraceae bacterium]|nr:4Fe-4S dicluster domain-containing protein [Nitrospiraceae bacterium]MDA8326920.1 4Fe-4S dicluster domain-containing protein [Nitrospiraceae bacterium]